LNALFPSVDALTGIVIGVDPAGAGVGVGSVIGDGDEYPPHAVASSSAANTKLERNDNIKPPDR
jgi:hypothetical protein